jgi:hypothetical protein
MANPNEKEIKKRAYELWEEAGKPEGREDEFWQLAEQELRNESKSCDAYSRQPVNDKNCDYVLYRGGSARTSLIGHRTELGCGAATFSVVCGCGGHQRMDAR